MRFYKKILNGLKQNKSKVLKLSIGIFVILFFANIKVYKEPRYQTTKPTYRQISETIECGGNLYPKKLSKIDLPESTQIKELKKKVGQRVKKDEVVAQLDDTAEQEQYKSALSAYYAAANARNRLKEAQEQAQQNAPETLNELADRLEQLANNDPQLLAIAQSLRAYAAASSNLNSFSLGNISLAQSSINMAYAQVQQAKRQIEAKKVKAPISGVIVANQITNYDLNAKSSGLSLPSISGFNLGNLNMGDFSQFSGTSSQEFKPQKQNVIYIMDDSAWYTYCKLPQNDFLKVQKKQKVVATLKNSNIKLNGFVTYVYKMPLSLENESTLYPVKIRLFKPKNLKKLYPGLNLSVSIITKYKEKALTLPLEAIYYDEQNKPYVYVKSGTAKQKKYVTLGIQGTNYVEIINGIDEKDEVVIKELKPKTKITLKFLHK